MLLIGYWWLTGPADLGAQTSPTDLADLSLLELVSIRVLPDDSNSDRRWAIGYRHVIRSFEGYLDGTESLSFDRMLLLYPVVPTTITQEAHILEATFRYSERVQLSVMVPFLEQSTDHIRRAGSDFNITTRGIGDVRFSAAYALGSSGVDTSEQHPWVLKMGFSLPSGSIDQKGDTPRGRDTQVPYTMQTGSGTYNFEPAVAFSGKSERLSWTSQASAVVRLGRNDRDYSLGDRLLITSQAVARPGKKIEPWVKAMIEIWGGIDGGDSELNPQIAPVADARLFGGQRLDLQIGFRAHLGKQLRSVLEIAAGLPIHQDLQGPQPKRRWEATAGWKSYF